MDDIEYLKDQYKQARKAQYEQDLSSHDYALYRGIAKGLEIALRTLGVSNSDIIEMLEKIVKENKDKNSD